jgi:hypothetical protein
MNWKGFERRQYLPDRVLYRHFLGRTEKSHENFSVKIAGVQPRLEPRPPRIPDQNSASMPTHSADNYVWRCVKKEVQKHLYSTEIHLILELVPLLSSYPYEVMISRQWLSNTKNGLRDMSLKPRRPSLRSRWMFELSLRDWGLPSSSSAHFTETN